MRSVVRLIILCFSIQFQALLSWAQPRQTYRLEIPGKASDEPYDVISMETEGLALIRDLKKYALGNKKWQVELVDTTLTRFWSTELDLDSRLNLAGYEHVPGRLYLLYRETQTTYYNFLLITMEFSSHSIQIDKVTFDLNFQLTHFTVSGRTALFGGYVNSEPAVLLFDHSSDQPKILPGLFAKNISLLDVRANQNESFNVLLVENRRTEKHKLILRTFDPSGNLIIEDVIEIDPRFSILSGTTSRLIHDELMIAGTFGEGNQNQALGVYSVVVDPFSEQVVTYTDLASIDHFLDYVPDKKARKMKSKTTREKTQGKVPGYKANLLPIRLEELDNRYYLFAEMYHPASNTMVYPYGSPAWNNYYNSYWSQGNSNRSGGFDNPYPNEPMVRNTEVKMIQAVLLRFKTPTSVPDGITMKFDDVKRPVLNQTGDFILRSDSVLLFYKQKNEILYQRESDDPMSRPLPEKVMVAMLDPTDFFKDEDEEAGGVRAWYGKHVYTWGYRKVRTTMDGNVESRYAFYVNRLDF